MPATLTADRPVRPWERPNYRPAPTQIRQLQQKVRDSAGELRDLLSRLADRCERLDLTDVANGFDANAAADMARAARGLEWAVEAGVAQLG